jgi:Glycosyl transferase family 2
VKVVMTLLARDEADIVDAQVAFHLHAGVDFVIAMDNASTDGTTEILERYERAGVLRLIRESSNDMRQDEWVTGMARLAATEHGADWVINSDADEFWWPRGGSLKDVLAAVPTRYGVVRGVWRHFLPRPDDGAFFAERMTVRLALPAPPGDKGTIFHAHQKVAHRAHALVEVERGNHNAEAPGIEPLRTWHPIEVMHFSFRSSAQLEQKARGGWARAPGFEGLAHQVRLHEAANVGRVGEFYDSHAIDDDGVLRGLADGSVGVDMRLRDALRLLRRGDGSFVHPGGPPVLTFLARDVTADAELAAEIAPLEEIEGIVRAAARVAALENRLARIEQGPLGWLRRLARR